MGVMKGYSFALMVWAFGSCCILFPAQLFAQHTIKHSIYLIGDAGKDTIPGAALRLLGDELRDDQNSTVVFLGDNVYPTGLDGKEGQKKLRASEMKLLSQLSQTVDHKGFVYWVPGNHDWQAGKWNGLELVKREAAFVEDYYTKNGDIRNKGKDVFLPKGGFPGPHLAPIGENGHLIAIDVQWWLHDQFFHKVPRYPDMSKREMEEQFLVRLDSMLGVATSAGGPVLIVAHHPLYSNGHHGQPKQPFRFIFNWMPPFHLFGLIGLNRALVQDIPQMRYKRIRNKILKVMDKYQGVIYAAGHDHNLQFFKKGDNYHIISGSGSKRSSLKGDRYGARFMDDRNNGFIRIDVMDDGKMQGHVFGHITGKVFHSFLLD